MITRDEHDLFRRLCDEATRFVLVTHIHPDGDALGSEISLAHYLVAQDKKVRILNNDPTSQTLSFIESETVPVELYNPAEHDPVLLDADRIVLLDNSAPDRLGRMEASMLANRDKTLCIDHHPAREAPWAHNIVDVESCATAAMIFEMTRSAGWDLDPNAAEAIYTGLATDTGFFRFNSTNARAHEVAAELLGMGVSPARAYREVYERNSEAFTRLLGHALAGLRLDADGAVASVKITRQLVETLQAEDVDTSEIATVLLAMSGVRVVMLFRELRQGRIKVSLRSKDELDVHGLATAFGGGGHRNASGIVIEDTLENVARTITDRATSLLDTATKP